MALPVASLVEAWIEIFLLRPVPSGIFVASLVEAWIEMVLLYKDARVDQVASLVEAWIEMQVKQGKDGKAYRRLPRGGVD